jgi:cation diffusion facilitator CzcD-associated flavoprotein CzcO
VFDPDDQRWIVHTTNGTFTAQFLLNGNGYFSEPYVPVFVDSEKFKGEIIHTARLDSRRTFFDKDVALVGSGSTAISCAPELSTVSRSLVLIQRSPSYVYEISNKLGLVTRLCRHLHQKGLAFPVKPLRYCLQAKDDAIFVVFRQFPRFARWFFKRHWLQTIGDEAFERHFTPRYNPWEQRIAVAIGLKEKLQSKAIGIKTSAIERFTESSIVLADGEHITCDVCVLATGFDLKLVKFDMYVGNQQITLAGVNFYKGIMVGGVPNYFHPFGAWHTAWTETSETATRFGIKIMTYMRRRGLGTVSIDRKDVEFAPPLTANYIKRAQSSMPKFYGSYNLPMIDKILSYRFKPSSFTFA